MTAAAIEPLTTDLTTILNVKDWLAITNDGDDRVLQRLISSCSLAANRFMNRVLLSNTYTESYDGNDNTRLMLREWPITAVASLNIYTPLFPWSYGYQSVPPGPAVGGTVIPVSPDGAQYQPGYSFDNLSIFVAGYKFVRGKQNVIVTYTAGYTAVPMNVEQAIIEWVADRFRLRSRIGEKSKAIPQGGSVTYETNHLPARVKNELLQYKRQIPV